MAQGFKNVPMWQYFSKSCHTDVFFNNSGHTDDFFGALKEGACGTVDITVACYTKWPTLKPIISKFQRQHQPIYCVPTLFTRRKLS